MEHEIKPKINKNKLEHWTAIIHAWKQSGKSQKLFCNENGFSLATFCYWLHKISGKQKLIIPVKVLESKPKDALMFRIETAIGVRIYVPSGANAEDLRTIFKSLGVI